MLSDWLKGKELSPENKTCTQCGEIKSRLDFYVSKASSDGLRPECKACDRAYGAANSEKIAAATKRYRAENQEKIAAAKRKYQVENSEKIAAAKRRYRAENSGKVAAAKRRYQVENQEKNREATSRWAAKNPEKKRAHWAVASAMRAGALTRQPCEVCGTTDDIHAHHDNYAKQLEVRWLCRIHHVQVHQEHNPITGSSQ